MISSTQIQVPTLIGCFFYLLKSFFCYFLNNLGCEEVRIIGTKILLSTYTFAPDFLACRDFIIAIILLIAKRFLASNFASFLTCRCEEVRII